MCANFQAKQIALTFSAQILPKIDLGMEIQKDNVGIRISILVILYMSISGKTNNFDFSGRNLPENGFWVRNFKNVSPDFESTPPRYHVCQLLVELGGGARTGWSWVQGLVIWQLLIMSFSNYVVQQLVRQLIYKFHSTRNQYENI